MSDLYASDIELIEVIAPSIMAQPGCPIAPNQVRINGRRVAVDKGSKIQIADVSDSECVKVTLTLYARSLVIKHEARES